MSLSHSFRRAAAVSACAAMSLAALTPALALAQESDDAAAVTPAASASASASAPAETTAAGAPAPAVVENERQAAEEAAAPAADAAAQPGAQAAQPAAHSTLSIAEIQGEGSATPYEGQSVTTRGVVTATYAQGGISGYYIQTPGTGGGTVSDRSNAASDALFVYDGKGAARRTPGECVEVTGQAGEYNSLTQLSRVSKVRVLDDCAPVTATDISENSWLATDADRERFEGMLLRPVGAWMVTDNYALSTYGQVGLAVGDKALRNATDVVAPGEEAVAYEAANAARTISLDDGSTWNYSTNKTARTLPLPYLTLEKSLRVGDAVSFTNNVLLDNRYGGWSFQPLQTVHGQEGSPISWESSRPAAPQVGGQLSLTSFNVLNYFTDLGEDEEGCRAYTDRDGNPITANRCQVRGAYSQAAFEAQQAKIVSAINELDSSVVGLEEIENSAVYGKDRDAALATLVTALNKAAGSEKWAFVPSPASVPEGEDTIRTAFIYQPALVTPVGESQILDDAAFSGTARQPLAQEFKPVNAAQMCQVGKNVEARSFIAVVNHFKSKGSVLDGEGNKDAGDGQGANNAQRVAQAKALVNWAKQWEGKPVALLGDFNSYAKEDPIRTMVEAGYRPVEEIAGEVGQSYVYGGRSGSLDHVLLSPEAAQMVAGARVWDVNADEPIAYEYSRMNANVTQLLDASPYRSSDHDPIKVGLRLVAEPGQSCEVVPTPGPSEQPSDKPSEQPSTKPSEPTPGPSVQPSTKPSEPAQPEQPTPGPSTQPSQPSTPESGKGSGKAPEVKPDAAPAPQKSGSAAGRSLAKTGLGLGAALVAGGTVLTGTLLRRRIQD